MILLLGIIRKLILLHEDSRVPKSGSVSEIFSSETGVSIFSRIESKKKSSTISSIIVSSSNRTPNFKYYEYDKNVLTRKTRYYARLSCITRIREMNREVDASHATDPYSCL